MFVLGGRAGRVNVELHDVRWVVGSRIEETYHVLRGDWFGSFEGLHIDTYKKIKYLDGHKINLKKIENKILRNNKLFDRKPIKKNL